MFSILDDLLRQFISGVPRIAGALLVALFGYLIARFAADLLRRLLKVSGVDLVAAKINDIDMMRQYNIQIVPSVVLSKIVYYFLLFIFIIGATDILQMPAVSKLMSDLIGYFPNLVAAAIVLVVGLWIADVFKKIALTAANSLHLPAGKLIANAIFYFILINAVISALSQAKIDTDFIKSNFSILLGGGVAAFAIAYGLAARATVSNFLATYYAKSKFKINDVISVLDVSGTIIALDGNSITIQTGQDKVIIPLSKLVSEKVTIHS